MCAFLFFNRLPGAPPVGSVHHKGQFLAIFTQAGNKQNICWHFPAVSTMTRTPLLPISRANACIFVFFVFLFCFLRPSDFLCASCFHIGTRRGNHRRGRKRSLMCKFAVIRFLSRHTLFPSRRRVIAVINDSVFNVFQCATSPLRSPPLPPRGSPRSLWHECVLLDSVRSHEVE